MAIINNDVDIQAINYNGTNLTKVICDGVVVWPSSYYTDPFWMMPSSNGTITYEHNSDIPSQYQVTKTIEYSLDKTTWSSFPSAGISATAGQKVYFRSLTSGDSFCIRTLASRTYTAWKRLYCTSQYSIGGNISSLFNGSSSLVASVTTSQYCYALGFFFYEDTNLTDASELRLDPITMGQSCYTQMFMGCTSLTHGPTILATTLASACCNLMFFGCTSLVTLPKLYATDLKGESYHSMFSKCTAINIKTAPAWDASHPYRIPFTGNGITTGQYSTETMFSYIPGDAPDTPSINTTYYTNATVV